MFDYRVQIKFTELSDSDYPSFAEAYFGNCYRWFSTKQEAVAYLNTFDDWEQSMLEIVEHEVNSVIPF
jgi:hypothetical protein